MPSPSGSFRSRRTHDAIDGKRDPIALSQPLSLESTDNDADVLPSARSLAPPPAPTPAPAHHGGDGSISAAAALGDMPTGRMPGRVLNTSPGTAMASDVLASLAGNIATHEE
jgi:hypothetical protein